MSNARELVALFFSTLAHLKITNRLVWIPKTRNSTYELTFHEYEIWNYIKRNDPNYINMCFENQKRTR